MATFNPVNKFSEDLGKGVHIFGTHQLKVALTNTAPTTASATYASLTAPLATTNLSGATPFNVTSSYTASGGSSTNLICTDLTLTATGAVGPFRYVVLYNDTPTSPADPVLGWYDYGSSVTMANTETFVIDFAANSIVIG